MSEQEDISKYSKTEKEVSKYDFTICPNCGETEVGKFCPNCGQSNKDFNKPIKEILSDLFGSINLDVRIINTITPFFLKPGFLSQEYFKGRRQRYVPPMRLYMFFSIIFFFLAQYSSIKSINKPDTLTPESDSTLQFFSLSVNDTVNLNFNEIIQSDTTELESIKKSTQGIKNILDNKESFISSFLKNLSYVLFLLMPFFALILALTLWRSRLLYVKHLVFSINFHSFVFGISSLVIILSLIFPDSFSEYFLYLLWGIPFYLMVGINRFYNRRMIGAFFKMIGILSLYFFIILIVLGSIFIFILKDFS